SRAPAPRPAPALRGRPCEPASALALGLTSRGDHRSPRPSRPGRPVPSADPAPIENHRPPEPCARGQTGSGCASSDLCDVARGAMLAALMPSPVAVAILELAERAEPGGVTMGRIVDTLEGEGFRAELVEQELWRLLAQRRL